MGGLMMSLMVFYPALIAGGCLCGWPHDANMNTA